MFRSTTRGVICMWFVWLHQRWYWIIGPLKYCYPTFWILITQRSFRDYPLWSLFPHADPNQSFSISPSSPPSSRRRFCLDRSDEERGRRKRGREHGPKHLPLPLQTQQLPEQQRWRDHRIAAHRTHIHMHSRSQRRPSYQCLPWTRIQDFRERGAWWDALWQRYTPHYFRLVISIMISHVLCV